MSQINPLDDELDPVKDGEYLAPTPMEINTSVDPSDVIKTTQSIRLKMIQEQLKGGVPSVDKDATTFLQVLRDLDQAALTTRKIDVDEQQLSESQRLADANNNLLKMLGGKNPFVIEIGGIAPVIERAPVELPAPQLVPDVTAQGTQPVNYDDFVSSVEAAEAKLLAEEED